MQLANRWNRRFRTQLSLQSQLNSYQVADQRNQSHSLDWICNLSFGIALWFLWNHNAFYLFHHHAHIQNGMESTIQLCLFRYLEHNKQIRRRTSSTKVLLYTLTGLIPTNRFKDNTRGEGRTGTVPFASTTSVSKQ